MAPTRLVRPVLLALLALFPAARSAAADPQSPVETAAKVDAALTRGSESAAPLPALADDETFLRRVYLDLTGKLPEPDAIRRFVADASRNKRAKVIDELLETETY